MVGNGVRPIRSAGIRAGVSVGPPAVESRPLLLLDMTLRVLVGQLERYAELPRSVPELHEQFCAGIDQDIDPEGRFRLVNGEPTVNFGKNRGRTLKEMSRDEPGFFRWILKGDFSDAVKDVARKYLPAEEQAPLFRS